MWPISEAAIAQIAFQSYSEDHSAFICCDTLDQRRLGAFLGTHSPVTPPSAISAATSAKLLTGGVLIFVFCAFHQ